MNEPRGLLLVVERSCPRGKVRQLGSQFVCKSFVIVDFSLLYDARAGCDEVQDDFFNVNSFDHSDKLFLRSLAMVGLS